MPAVGVAAILMALAAVAARWGYADVDLNQASREFARWGMERKSPNLESWLDVRNTLIAAQRLEPNSPTILETLGLIHSQRVTTGSGSEVFQEQALDYFKQAAVQRPTSPYTWANIALTKYRLGQIDAELRRSLSIAAMLGPWEPEVQFIVSDLGFALWDELPKELRKTVLDMAGHGMKRYADNMVRIAENRGRLGLACQSSADAVKHAKCRQLSGNSRAVIDASYALPR